jgi:hypothetical protein
MKVIKPSPDDGHIPQKNPFTNIMTHSANTSTLKSEPPAAHYYESTVHDIASDTELSKPENSSTAFVRGNTRTLVQQNITKSFIKHFE